MRMRATAMEVSLPVHVEPCSEGPEALAAATTKTTARSHEATLSKGYRMVMPSRAVIEARTLRKTATGSR
jgi:hypothetical protein